MKKPMPIPDHARRWNELAEKYNLHKASVYQAKERAEQIAYYQTLVEDFWADLDAALGRRGTWAIGRRFPNFDQVLDEAIAAKLFEGYYEDEDSPQKEHEALVAQVVCHRGGDRLPAGGTVSLEGIDGPRGLERWAEVSVERLQSVLAWR